ncbi:MAG: 3'-5' exonuclease [Geitlerinemataceae cyanobacterium]
MAFNLLIIDTETTGLNPEDDRVIELGAILYNVDYQTVLHQISMLCPAPENPAEKINRIPSSVLPTIEPNLQRWMLLTFEQMVKHASYAVAHNAEFDRQWFDDRHLPKLMKEDRPMQWLCTMDDFTWPRQNRPGESLVTLALAHGIGVSSAHRALTDCQLIAALFDRMDKDQLSELIAAAARPKYLFKADVSYDDRQLAKDAGFKWNPDRKMWTRKMVEEDTQLLPFRVVKIQQPLSLAA